MSKHILILLISTGLAGCTPSSGGATRDPSDEASPGAGTASMSWDLSGRRERTPSDSEIDSIRSGPMPPPSAGSK
jgi:hypothetical protein